MWADMRLSLCYDGGETLASSRPHDHLAVTVGDTLDRPAEQAQAQVSRLELSASLIPV